MRLLAGGAAALFGELLAPLYLPARVTEQATTYTTAGDLQRTSGERACLAQVDSATETMKGAEGYADTDQAIYILADSLAGVLTSDHDIEVLEGEHAGATFHLAAPITRDPACAYWLCRGIRVRAAPRG